MAKINCYTIDPDTGRVLEGPEDRTRHSSEINNVSYELIAQLRGTAPRKEVRMAMPRGKTNIFYAHTQDGSLKVYAFQQNISRANLDALLSGNPARVEYLDENELLAGLTAKEIKNPETGVRLTIRNYFEKLNQRRLN